MSNKYLIPLIIAILISTIVAVSVNQFNKFSNNKVAIVSSSSVVATQSSVASISSVTSQIVSSSVQVQSSLLPIFSSTPKVVESKKVEVKSDAPIPASIETKNENCKIPSEMMKFKSDSGCYTSQVQIPYDTDDSYPLNSKELADFSKDTLGKDFYNRVKGLTNSSYISIIIRGATKISENTYQVGLGFLDIEYIRSNNIIGTHAETFEGSYTVNLNDPKSFKLDNFTDRTKK
jgi:hypothetical protein